MKTYENGHSNYVKKRYNRNNYNEKGDYNYYGVKYIITLESKI